MKVLHLEVVIHSFVSVLIQAVAEKEVQHWSRKKELDYCKYAHKGLPNGRKINVLFSIEDEHMAQLVSVKS